MESFETGLKVDGPLAGNIIRDFDVADLTTVEICGNNIIGVDVAKMRSESLLVHWEWCHTVLHAADHQRRLGEQNNGVRRQL